MRKQLFVALACLFVEMIGFGITLPVLPFYVERLALARRASRQSVVLHVTLLTAVYALAKRGGESQAGASFGVQNAANSLGQAIGPVVGGALFIWQINAPNLLIGALLITVALLTGWKTMNGGARRTQRRFE